MKKSNQHKKLKQLSDQHEVPFNPAAWDRMEAMLDSTPPTEEPQPGASFFNYKNIIAMLILLTILGYFAFPGGEIPNDSTTAETHVSSTSQDIYISENIDSTKQQTKEITSDDLEKNNRLGGGLTTDGRVIDPNDPSPQIISEPQPIGGLYVAPPNSNLGIKTIKVPEFISKVYTKFFPADNVFIDKIKETLIAYAEFRKEEKVYLHFDRTMLKPGEAIWFSGYVREANTLKASEQSDILYVDFIAPNGGVLKQLKLITENGVAKGDIQTSESMVGGIYTIKAYTNWQRNFQMQFERKITLQKTVLPNLRMELDFEKEAYGSGDEVMAKLDLNTLENTPLSNFDFTYKVSLEGANISQQNSKTDEKGIAKFKFTLPKNLETNDGLVNVLLQYNGQGESISRSIPIVLNKMDVQFFAEGGDMIAGFDNKIAFKAINEFGKPGDVEGVVLNSNGEKVSDFQSYHNGMGAFNFEPVQGEKYIAKITKPANIIGEFPLPQSLDKGHLMQVLEVSAGKMKVQVQNAESQSLTLVLQSQGRVIYSTSTEAQQGTHVVEIPTKRFPIGIAQLTLFDEKERPHAERLVFLNKEKSLDISITTNKEQYLPREKVKMEIQVKDENGIPVQGQFSVGVTDDKLLSFADDKQGKMLAYMLLESDLKGDIHKPNFYFEPKEKHADKDQNLALDYLMLTNGWRRYTWKAERDAIAGMIYPNEKAVIAGRILDYQGQPVKGAVVRIDNTEKVTVSDEQGKFAFNNFPIARKASNGQSVSISATKGGHQRIVVNNYGENYVMYLPDVNINSFATKYIPRDGSRKIQGKITDANGEGLIGANVYLEGTSIGAITDLDGNYLINNVPAGSFALRTDYVGFQPVSQAIVIRDNQSVMANAKMSDAGISLNEVVVTSSVPTLRQTVNASSAVQSDDVLDMRQPIVEELAEEALQGNVAGVVVTKEQIRNLPTRNINAVAAATAGSIPADEGAAINIRGSRGDATDYFLDGVFVQGGNHSIIGFGALDEELEPAAKEGGIVLQKNKKKRRVHTIGDKTIVSEEPLVVIDGVKLSKIAMTKINPADIKSAEVLQDDDALATKYGPKAKNGVILIDTKKRKGTSTNQELLDYQNEITAKANAQILEHQENYDWAKKMIAQSAINGAETRNLRIALNASLNKIQRLRTLGAELGRLTGIYPATNYANRDFSFIEDYEYAHSFRNGYYSSRDFYSPKYFPTTKKEVRDDFRPTVFWNPIVETDSHGKALLEFYNSDDLTTFKATVEGLTPSGKIGAATHTYFTQMPFGMRTKFPNQILVGDVLNIPVTISNNTSTKMEVRLDAIVPQGFEYVGKKLSLYTLQDDETKTVYLPFKVKSEPGEHELEVKVSANGEEDSFTKTVSVLSRGFPVEMMFSGSDLEKQFEVEVSDMIEASMQAKFTVYPSLLSDLSQGMERMIRQPTGCFEQTSSKNYPNLLVLDYLNNTNNLDQALGQKLYDVLEKGYQRLLTFEVQGGGFDWYGRPPAHEGLTAYGLMQFKDMQEVHRVDQDVIDRTAKWLLTRKDGQGGWKTSKHALHSWSAGNQAGNAYITWAMTEAGFGNKVRPEIEKTYQDAKESKDAYVMALAILALDNINDSRANKLMSELLKLQQENGSWTATTTMTRSGGKSLLIETTSLAALAILQTEKGYTQLEKATSYIGASKNNYGFGSTQSTVLAMKALIEHAKYSTNMQTDGMVTLMIDGKKAATQAYTSNQKSPIVFDQISELLTEGKHDVKVLFEGTETALPYDLAVSYNTTLPKSDANCKVKLQTELTESTSKIAENIRLTIQLQNTTNEALPNTIARIGIPSGLNLQPWQLKELQEKNTFDYYEIFNGELILHYRGMQAAETKTINLDLKADLAGSYEAPASSAYLYYTNEFISWSKPDVVTIEAE